MSKILSKLTLEELQELRWVVYWESSTMLKKQWFNWAVKQGIIKKVFDLMTHRDSFCRWDVEREIQRRSLN